MNGEERTAFLPVIRETKNIHSFKKHKDEFTEQDSRYSVVCIGNDHV
jgi:hypothetical protein